MSISAMTRRNALVALSAFGLSLTGAASSARAQSGLRFSAIVVNVAPLRPLTGEPDRLLDGAGARAGSAARLGASSRAGRARRADFRSPNRLDLSRPEPRRAGAEGFGAGHDHRKLPCSGTARRNRVGNPVAGDCVLLSERGRPGACRASLSRTHCRSRPDLRRLGAEGTWALGGACRCEGVEPDADFYGPDLRTGQLTVLLSVIILCKNLVDL